MVAKPMNPESWRQIEQLYFAARARPDEQVALLAETDPEIRSEVERMLAAERAPHFLDHPVDLEPTKTVVSVGAALDHYRIEASIGKGGMGQVFRAVDTRLNRTVAIKTSLDSFDARFLREARAASALNHPHICTVHDVGEWNGRSYIVMEYLDGTTLKELVARGPLPLPQLMAISDQIADALEAAHAAHIIHRDIKPANIFITRRGQVKVLDFGLAKETERQDTGESSLTAVGAVMGTASYMSPEQARGEPLDARTDLFSLGVVMYEMATGRRPFASDSVAATLGAILHIEPVDPCSLNPALPVGLRDIIAGCLKKDRESRYQSASEVREALATIYATDRRRTPRWTQWAVAAGIIAAITGAGAWYWRTHRGPLITGDDRLVVAEFVNRTGDPVFDHGTMREATILLLDASDLVRPMSPGQEASLLTEMRQPTTTTIDDRVAKEMCIRASEKAMLGGSITAFGTNHLVIVKVTSCQSGDILAIEKAVAKGRESVPDALAIAIESMREKLGESLGRLEKPGSIGTMRVITGSPEAFQAFTKGMAEFRLAHWANAAPHFQRARDIDDSFAWAWLMEATCGTNERRASSLEVQNLLKEAYARREQVSYAERLVIEAMYQRFVQIDRPAAQATLEAARSIAPHASLILSVLANIYRDAGDTDHAVPLREQMIKDEPDAVQGYVALMSEYTFADQFDEAKRVADQPEAHKLNHPLVHRILLEIAYIEGDQAAQDREITALGGSNAPEVLALRRDRAFLHGRFREGNTLTQHATSSLDTLDYRAFARDCGFLKDMQGPASWLLTLCKWDSTFVRRAEQLAQEPDVDDRTILFPAMLALANHQYQHALDILDPLSHYGARNLRIPFLRGRAFAGLGNHKGAAREYQKLISRRSLQLLPSYAAAHVLVAKELKESGNIPEAKEYYKKFLDLWKDADPDIPLLIDAKKEYKALQ